MSKARQACRQSYGGQASGWKAAVLCLSLALNSFSAPAMAQDAVDKPFARGYRVEPADLDETLRSLRELYESQPGISINADKRTSKIVVFGPAEVHQEVALALAVVAHEAPPQEKAPRTLSIAPAPGRRQRAAAGPQRLEAVHRFRNLTWEDFEDALQQIWGDQVEVTPDVDGEAADVRLVTRDGETHFIRVNRRRNQLEATQAEPMENWKKVARVLDSLETKAGQEAELLPVTYARPIHVKDMVHALQTSALDKTKPLAIQALARNAKTARWGGDLVSRVFQQDPPAAPAGQDPAQEPQPPTPEEEILGEEPISPDVRIEYIEGLDIIVIIGPPKDVARVKKLIQLLDDPKAVQPAVEIVTLQHTNNEVLAPILTQINDQVLSTRQGRVTIIPLGKPNSIMLIGQEESVKSLRDYIEKLDVEVESTTQYRIYKLKYIPATDAETAIRNFFSNQPGQGGQGAGQGTAGAQDPRPGLGTRVRIIAEYRSNSLIIQGGPGDFRDVEALLKDIDVEDSPSVVTVRIFPLKSSLATDVAPILQSAITGQAAQGAASGAQGQGTQPAQGQGTTGTSRSSPQSASLQFVQVKEDGTTTVESGIPTNVIVTADPISNQVVVRGPARTMELVAQIVAQLDKAASGGASIRVFRILHGDAQQIYTNLNTLFGTAQQAGGQGQGGVVGPATTEGESPLVGLRFTFDRSSNSIIATGNPGDLNMVQAVLDNIDMDDLQKRSLVVYRLVNNDCQFVANAITTLINSQQQLLRQQIQTNFLMPARTLFENEVFVTPEVVTNSVIISATPKKLEEIVRVIQQLDLRQPMVLVQMIIAEVTLENDNELGAEFGLQDSILFDRGIGNPGDAGVVGFPWNNTALGNTLAGQQAASANNVGGQALSSFGLGRTSNSRGYGGLVLSASSESVSVLIRALQERSRLQILSRPEVMTVDRIPANVLVGEQVPLVGSINTTSLTNVQSSVDRRSVGLQMIVIPQVNADGQIIIDVNASRSSLGSLADGIPIPAGNGGTVLQPRINITQAVSTISCRSGQTVIMSGLITKQRQLKESGIPGLMDVPILGNFFKFRSESDRRTELLMILTPHIIWDGEDLEWIKQTETERMSWCMSDVADLDGDRGYSPGKGLWGSLKNRTIFPHVQPRGVEACTPPPGPLSPAQRLRAALDPSCPPDPEWQPPPGSDMPPGPPSELQGRSYWQPNPVPQPMLGWPPPNNGSRLEEVPPPLERAPENENTPEEYRSTPEEAPPAAGPALEPPRNPESTSLRSVLRAKNASTRRSATTRPQAQGPRDISEEEIERTAYPPASRSKPRNPAPREVEPASYSRPRQ